MVPTFTCGLDRSNFSLAMSQEPRALVLSYVRSFSIASSPSPRSAGEPFALAAVLLRPSGYGGHPSRGLPSVAHALHARRERRMEPMTRIELVTSSLPRTRSAN